MKKRILIMAVCAFIAMNLAMPLDAQTRIFKDVGELESSASKATAGLFTNDVDDYMSVHDYANVLTDEAKWFGFISGKYIVDGLGGVLDMGFARKFSGFYAGVWYRGNIFRTRGNNPYETKSVRPEYDDDLEILTSRTDTISYNEVWNESTNNIEFLIGVADMGIKVGFFESASSNKNKGNPDSARLVTVTDYLDGHKEYVNAIEKYTDSQSYLKPYIGWGGTFAVSDLSVSPFVNFGFGINGDKLIDKYRNYAEVNGVSYNLDAYAAGHNNRYLEPLAEVGAWLNLPPKSITRMNVGLSYGFNFKLYNNSADGLGKVNGTVNWGNAGPAYRETKFTDRTETVTDMTFNIDEQSYMRHTIIPAYKITGEMTETFKFGFLVELPITITSESSNQYRKRIQQNITKYNWDRTGTVRDQETVTYADTAGTLGGNTKTSAFGIDLHLALGASCQLIPGRFGINAGFSAEPLRYTRKVKKTTNNSIAGVYTDKTTLDDGSVTVNDKTVTFNDDQGDAVEVTNEWHQFTARLCSGFTFNFYKDIALDFSITGDIINNTFDIKIANLNVIITVKF